MLNLFSFLKINSFKKGLILLYLTEIFFSFQVNRSWRLLNKTGRCQREKSQEKEKERKEEVQKANEFLQFWSN